MDQLFANLIDLLRELDTRNVPLTVGGGLGLYLKRRHLDTSAAQTLFPEMPGVRATNDIDMFLRADILANFERTKDVARALENLGYIPVNNAKFFQWKRPVLVGGFQQEVKIDVLVGPVGRYRDRLKVTPPRARPKGQKLDFHAFVTEEALHIDEQPVAVIVEGLTSDSSPYRGTVFVPEAFPYLMMKLHAFNDRKADANKDLGRHHAFDVYTIVGMMMQIEYDRAKVFGALDRDDEHVHRARDIVALDFSSATALGILRIREHTLFRSNFRLGEFMAVLREIFSDEGNG